MASLWVLRGATNFDRMLSMASVPDRQHTVNTGRPPVVPRTPAGDAFSALAIEVIRVHGRLISAGDTMTRPLGQSSARWQVLAGAESGQRTVADIARALDLARQSVQRVADLLAAEGLLAYEDNPRDRRARLTVLTAAGRALLRDIQTAQAGWANDRGALIGESRLRQATAVLERVRRTLAR
jgi:DNA-binding MarR family transcriptional regulator